MNYNWNWAILWATSPEGHSSYITTLFDGLLWTLLTTAGAWTVAMILGTVIGVARTLPHKVASMIASSYVEVFRNIPVLVQLFLWYFVLPELVSDSLGAFLKQIPAFYIAVLGLGFYTSARVAGPVYAGITQLPRGQMLAAKALGMKLPQIYAFVILPQAFRVILPPLTSELLGTVKNSSVALTIGLVELTARARSMQEYSFQVFEAFTVATILYLIVNYAAVVAMRRLERRVAVPGLMSMASK